MRMWRQGRERLWEGNCRRELVEEEEEEEEEGRMKMKEDQELKSQ